MDASPYTDPETNERSNFNNQPPCKSPVYRPQKWNANDDVNKIHAPKDKNSLVNLAPMTTANAEVPGTLVNPKGRASEDKINRFTRVVKSLAGK